MTGPSPLNVRLQMALNTDEWSLCNIPETMAYNRNPKLTLVRCVKSFSMMRLLLLQPDLANGDQSVRNVVVT